MAQETIWPKFEVNDSGEEETIWPKFEVKDSGKRQEFASGMVRDVTEGKTNWALVADGPMLRRWAVHLTKGAQKYSPRNWMKASGDEEYERFRESAWRHFMAWYYGDKDEDHAAGVFFNINGAEYVAAHLSEPQRAEPVKPPNQAGAWADRQAKGTMCVAPDPRKARTCNGNVCAACAKRGNCMVDWGDDPITPC